MGGRSKSIPEDAKTRLDADSPWQKYPSIFAGVGVACLLIALVVGAFSGGSDHHGDDHGAPAEQHAEGGPDEAVQGSDDGHAGEAGHGSGDGHADEADHGSGDGHADEGGHGSGDGHAAEDGHGSDHAAANGAEAHGGEAHGHGPKNRFYYSYLTAYMYGLSLALGGLFFVLIQFLVKAGWSVVVRRIAENVMGTLPLFAILFVPLVFGFHDTHSHWWSVEPGVDSLLDGKRGYLNQPFFFVRAVVYFAIWIWLAQRFRKQSVAQDESGDQGITWKLQGLAPVGVILFGLTVTFAAIDWIKSMDPHWYSTMWGVYFFAGCLVAIFSSLAILTLWLQRGGVLHKVINVEHYHDIGKLMFGFTVFWTYIAFSQYFLIWYANIPEEQLWFEHRSHGGWREVGMFLAIGHFFVPFFFLIPRAIKRNPVTLFIGAAWLLFIHYVDIYFMIMPVYSHGFDPSVVDVLALVGVVCLFLAAFARLSLSADLVPRKDPRLPESLAFENF